MADKPVDEIVNLDAILDALPDSPTSSDVYEATLPFPARDVAASAAQRALNGGGGTPDLAAVLAEGAAAGGAAITGLADPSGDQDAATKKYVDDNSGGSQPSLRWRNVKTITYAEILAAGNGVPIDLVTIASGGLVDGYWFHCPVTFDDGGSIDYALGWLLDSGTPRILGVAQSLTIPQSGQGDDWAGAAGVQSGGFGNQGAVGASIPTTADETLSYGPLVLDSDVSGPLQIAFTSIAGDGTSGSLDIWLRIQDPAS